MEYTGALIRMCRNSTFIGGTWAFIGTLVSTGTGIYPPLLVSALATLLYLILCSNALVNLESVAKVLSSFSAIVPAHIPLIAMRTCVSLFLSSFSRYTKETLSGRDLHRDYIDVSRLHEETKMKTRTDSVLSTTRYFFRRCVNEPVNEQARRNVCRSLNIFPGEISARAMLTHMDRKGLYGEERGESHEVFRGESTLERIYWRASFKHRANIFRGQSNLYILTSPGDIPSSFSSNCTMLRVRFHVFLRPGSFLRKCTLGTYLMD